MSKPAIAAEAAPMVFHTKYGYVKARVELELSNGTYVVEPEKRVIGFPRCGKNLIRIAADDIRHIYKVQHGAYFHTFHGVIHGEVLDDSRDYLLIKLSKLLITYNLAGNPMRYESGAILKVSRLFIIL